jgi:hypothetical protein
MTKEFVIIIMESAYSWKKQEFVRRLNCMREPETFTNYTRDTRVNLRYNKHPA